MIGKLYQLFRSIARPFVATRELIHELRTFRSKLEAERAAMQELWALKDEARRHYDEVALPAWRREMEAVIRANPYITLAELERRCPGPSAQVRLH